MPQSTCTIAGCERPHNARGWCLPHYKRWQRYGDPEGSVQRHDPVCVIHGCDRPKVAHGWCAMHYQRWQRYGDAEKMKRERRVCVIDGCERLRLGRGWCSMHYTRWKRHGSPTARIKGEVVDGCRICPGCGLDKPTASYPYATGRCRACRRSQERVQRLSVVGVQLPAVHCIICTTSFIPRTNSSFCCSDDCSKVRKAALDGYYGAIGHNPEPKRQYAGRRRAAKRGSAVRKITKANLASRMAYFGNRCWMCRGPFEAIDHVKPIAKGGPHILANLRPACNRCNSAKSAEWAGMATVQKLSA